MGKVEFQNKEVDDYYNRYIDVISQRTDRFEDLYSEIESRSNNVENEEYIIASELLTNELAKREAEVTGSEIRYFAP